MSFEFLDAGWMYYLWATLLVALCIASWITNLFALPGNWGIVVAAAVFAYWMGIEDERGIGWTAIITIVGLAVVGEIIEFAAGAAGAAKRGGSRRGMVLSLVGAFAGSILGAIAGVPIPFIGSAVAAVGGGALGAFLGAYLGETWKGTTTAEGLEISKGALVGRLLGTVGKLAMGAIMLVVVAFTAYF